MLCTSIRALRSTLVLAGAVSATIVCAAAQTNPVPGFSARRIQLAPAGTFPGGFEVTPGGNLVLYDGAAIVERDRSGTFVRTVYSAAPTFGSFLRFSPDGSRLYFGESGAGNVFEIAWPSGSSHVFANVDFNYDLAFDPQGVPFVSANPGFAGQQILRLDPSTGAPDRIAAWSGPSGPIAFDAQGNLYAMIVPSSFPPPAGSFSLLRFTAAQVASAIGAGELTASQGAIVVGSLDGGSSLELDGEGRLLLTTGVELLSITPSGSVERLASAGPSDYLGAFAFERGTTPFFRPFGASSGGTVWLTTTDFATFYDAVELVPQRPSLGSSVINPVPPGPVTLTFAGAPAQSPLLLCVALQAAHPELALFLPRPFLLGVDPASLLVMAELTASGQGDLALPFVVPPGASGFASTWQVLLFDGAGPHASSAPLEILLQ